MRRVAIVLAVITAMSAASLTATGCSPSDPAQDSAALENTQWEVVEFATDEGMAAPSLLGALEGRLLTLELVSQEGPSGSASGNSGVNTFSGTWSAADDGTFELGPLATTKMAGPAPLMEQETAYLAALDKSEGFTVSGELFELLDADGSVTVRFKPGSPGPVLEGTLWRCTGYNNGQEAFVSVLADTEITTSFEGGRVTGNATVNDFSGQYTVDGAALTISSAAAITETEGPAELMDQESAYLAMLPQIERYKILGETMTVYGANDLRLAIYEIAR